MKKIAIFASGNGSNAENIINYFSKTPDLSFEIFTNNAQAGVIERAKRLNVPCTTFNKEYYKTKMSEDLVKNGFDWLILAGFLWLIPADFVNKYPEKIVNIHPALLPKYGGKGMYGDNVHKAVLNNKEIESGITIHYVDEVYDHGKTIFQAKCPITDDDKLEDLAYKIHNLEYTVFPMVLEKIILG